jgi:hypothetical protein
MPTVDIFATLTGQINSSNAVYATARTGGTLSAATGGNIFDFGQLTGPFRCIELFVTFDTSSIPDDATVTSVVFSLGMADNQSVTDFIAEARLHDWGGTLETTDWVSGADLGSKLLLATFDSAAYVDEAYNAFTESGTALSDNINKAGSTRFLVCSDRHRLGTQPSGSEYLDAYGQNSPPGDLRPKLTITYDEAPTEFGLTVTVVGGGTVTSSPAGINCPGDCSQTYDADTVVTLTATPDVGYEFVGWTGDGTGDPRVVTMDAAKAVTATFAAIPVPTPVPGGGTPILRTLGCGVWTAQIAERGGNVLVQAKATAGSMGRRLDDMSLGGAAFLLSDVPGYCMGVLAKLKAWQYELVLLRDGEESWVGPISDSVVFTRNDIAVSCRDLFQWYERRVHPVDRSLKRDLCETFEIYATDAMSRDPSPNITIDRDDCGIVERRTVLKSDERYVADSLRELGDDGVDWTMLARTLRLRGFGGGDLVGRLGAGHVETESVQVSKDGLGVASEWIVTGETPEGSDTAVSGRAGGVGSFTGLVQQVSQQELVVTQAGAAAAAEALLEVSGEEPMTLTCDLLGTASFTFDKLVPGNLFDVRMKVGVLTIDEVMMLQSVDVPDLVNEKVGVTFSRVGLPNVHQPEYAPAAGS